MSDLEARVEELERMLSGIPARFAVGGSGGKSSVIGKLNFALGRGTLAAPVSTTMTVWTPDSSDAWTASDNTVTIYDVGLMSSKSLNANTVVKADKVNNRWVYSGPPWSLVKGTLDADLAPGAMTTITGLLVDGTSSGYGVEIWQQDYDGASDLTAGTFVFGAWSEPDGKFVVIGKYCEV